MRDKHEVVKTTRITVSTVGLRVRMAVAVLGLLVVGSGLLGVTVAVSVFIGTLFLDAGFPPEYWGRALLVSAGAGCSLFVLATIIELRRADSFVSRQFDAREPTAEEHDRLVPRVRRLAQQFDLPEPTVRVAETGVVHASISGLSRERATLVISTGTLSALSEMELEAVLAHELAHVANRDATVCTIVSIPAMIAYTLMTWRPDFESESDHQPDSYTLYDLVGMFFWLVSKPFLSMFARQREYVADAAAATVTGNPNAVASALRTLSERTSNLPSEDLRTASAVATFSIVRPEPTFDSEYWPNETLPLYIRLRERLFATHPPIATRIERLGTMTADMERSGK
jgi:heat shock protein HtpX